MSEALSHTKQYIQNEIRLYSYPFPKPHKTPREGSRILDTAIVFFEGNLQNLSDSGFCFVYSLLLPTIVRIPNRDCVFHCCRCRTVKHFSRYLIFHSWQITYVTLLVFNVTTGDTCDIRTGHMNNSAYMLFVPDGGTRVQSPKL